MSNAIYPKWKEAIAQASANSSLGGTVKAVMVTSAYTYNAADEFLDDITAGTVGTAQTIGSKTYTNGVFDGADVTYTSVTAGSTVNALVVYIDTGVAGTSRLVAYIDTGYTNLPISTNGNSIAITWSASGIFAL